MPGMTPEVEKKMAEDLERVKSAYGADKEDFTKFPTFKFEGLYILIVIQK